MMKRFVISLFAAMIFVAPAFAQPPTKAQQAPPHIRNAVPPIEQPEPDVLREAIDELNNPAGTADLKTPENTVRFFVTALNNAYVEQAQMCVQGAQPLEKLKPLAKILVPDAGDHGMLISDFHAYVDVKKATVTLRLTPADERTVFSAFGVCERLHLVKTDDEWQILPSSAKVVWKPLSRTQVEDWLTQCATIIAVPEALQEATSQNKTFRCQSNLKELSLGVMMYIQDWDEVLPDAAKWPEQIMPYVKSNSLFLCPADETEGAKNSYAFNPNLTHINQAKIEETALTVLMFDAKNGELDFRHKLDNGEPAANIAFCDGHAKLVGEKEAKTLRWKP